mmetsp:Transcript_1066/g.2559  ORF Transcript_1066/g.2559 Transcript_1066/m.2559 type:complete len:248 (-) Transcript_1066:472-1215(-)
MPLGTLLSRCQLPRPRRSERRRPSPRHPARRSLYHRRMLCRPRSCARRLSLPCGGCSRRPTATASRWQGRLLSRCHQQGRRVRVLGQASTQQASQRCMPSCSSSAGGSQHLALLWMRRWSVRRLAGSALEGGRTLLGGSGSSGNFSISMIPMVTRPLAMPRSRLWRKGSMRSTYEMIFTKRSGLPSALSQLAMTSLRGYGRCWLLSARRSRQEPNARRRRRDSAGRKRRPYRGSASLRSAPPQCRCC